MSGEILWGQLASILSGVMTAKHDFPSTEDRTVPSGTVITTGYTFRAPAKVGLWKVRQLTFHLAEYNQRTN
jgi:hypothetical protein